MNNTKSEFECQKCGYDIPAHEYETLEDGTIVCYACYVDEKFDV